MNTPNTHLYTLAYQGHRRSFAEWGITNCKRSSFNPGDDTLSITQSIEKAPIAFMPEETLAIYANDQCIFQGYIVKAPIKKSVANAHYHYEIKGPLWYLENIVYEHIWIERDFSESKNTEPSQYTEITKGRIVLGQDKTGASIGLKKQIEAILHYAQLAGAPIACGNIDIEGPLPLEELQDVSCSEALMRVLRFIPDAVIVYDYSHPGIVYIHIQRYTHTRAIEITEKTHALTMWNITPRYDRVINGVILKYEKVHRLEGQAWSQTTIDAYPKNIQTRGLKTLVMTLELEGMRGHLYKQPIRVEPIEPENPLWWKRHLPSMHAIDFNRFNIQDISRTSTLPNELIQGGIAEWMGCSVEEDCIQALVNYETYTGLKVEETLSVKLYATSATNKTYTHTLIEGLEEAVPEGLAELLYNSLSILTYEGEIELYMPHNAHAYSIGTVLTLVHENNTYGPLWVQGMHYDFNTQYLKLQCAPGSLLKPDDFIEILRLNRQRQPLKRAYLRSAKQHKVPSFKQATHTRLDNTDRGGQQLKRLVITDREETQAAIILDAQQLPKNSRMELIEETVCHNGTIMNRLILATKPYLKTHET